jgi:hypothetical protein
MPGEVQEHCASHQAERREGGTLSQAPGTRRTMTEERAIGGGSQSRRHQSVTRTTNYAHPGPEKIEYQIRA